MKYYEASKTKENILKESNKKLQKENAHLKSKLVKILDEYNLSNIIREVDSNYSLGAEQLAEKIVEKITVNYFDSEEYIRTLYADAIDEAINYFKHRHNKQNELLVKFGEASKVTPFTYIDAKSLKYYSLELRYKKGEHSAYRY